MAAAYSSFSVLPSGPRQLDQLQPLQAGVSVLADDDVIVHGNAERLRHRDYLLRHLDIGARRCRIAGRMVVQDAL
jgi:hypothetical protein